MTAQRNAPAASLFAWGRPACDRLALSDAIRVYQNRNRNAPTWREWPSSLLRTASRRGTDWQRDCQGNRPIDRRGSSKPVSGVSTQRHLDRSEGEQDSPTGPLARGAGKRDLSFGGKRRESREGEGGRPSFCLCRYVRLQIPGLPDLRRLSQVGSVARYPSKDPSPRPALCWLSTPIDTGTPQELWIRCSRWGRPLGIGGDLPPLSQGHSHGPAEARECERSAGREKGKQSKGRKVPLGAAKGRHVSILRNQPTLEGWPVSVLRGESMIADDFKQTNGESLF